MMKMKAILAGAVMMSALAFAQASPGAGGRARLGDGTPDEAKAYLGLSDAQVTSLTELRRQTFEANRGIFDQLREKSRAMRELRRQSNPNQADIDRLTAEIKTLTDQLKQSRSAMHAKAVALLNAEQQAKLKTLEQAAALREEIREAHALGLLEGSGDGMGAGLGRRMGARAGRW